jgi:hypothetical protein
VCKGGIFARGLLLKVSRDKNRSCEQGVGFMCDGGVFAAGCWKIQATRIELAVWEFLVCLKAKMPYLNYEFSMTTER